MADYKQIAVRNERKLKEKVNRLELLLNNTLVLLFDVGCIHSKSDIHRLLNELGMTKQEYNEITGENL